MLTKERVSSLSLFNELPPDRVESLLPLLKTRTFTCGDNVFFRGDPGDSMFVIIDGAAAVTLSNEEGYEYTLAKLGEGDVFGEMALLTGEPRTANVKTMSDLTVIEIPQNSFTKLVESAPEVNTRLLRLLASRLGVTTSRHEAEQMENREILAGILCSRTPPPDTDSFPGSMKATAQLNDRIRELSKNQSNIMILGEFGTGAELVAALIHYGNKEKTRPFLSLDCANMPPVMREAAERAEDVDEVLIEASQQAALFGHEAGSSVFARGSRRGYLELADGGTLLLENVEHLLPAVQEMLAEWIRTGHFTRMGEEEAISSKVRIISTSDNNLPSLASSGSFNPELFKLLGAETIKLSPLRDLKKDIPQVAEFYLSKCAKKAHKEISGFTAEAMNALVDYAWPSNMAEMEQVLSRAVALSREGEIREENIFLDISPFSTEGKMNLLKIEAVDKVARHKLFPAALQFFTIPFFLFLVGYTIFGPQTNNLANLLAWAVLWPGLIFSVAISARSWCGYCPMSAISNIASYSRKNFFPVPNVIKKHGIWFGIAGFIFIIWIEHVTHMMFNPVATGILFLSILGGAFITTLLLGRRVWCLHLCPLGRMTGQFATMSMMELRSNSNVCLSQCTTHDCIKEKGCPMGLHPSSAKARNDCILCLTCLKNCTHRSVRIDVLFPWQKVTNLGKWEFPRGFFSVLLAATVIAIKGPAFVLRVFYGRDAAHAYLPVWLDAPVFLGIVAVITGVAFLASASKQKEKLVHIFTHAGYAYLPMAFFGFFNIYFRHFVQEGAHIPYIAVQFLGLGGFIRPEWVTPNLVTMKGLFPLITISGTAFAIYLLREISRRYDLPKRSMNMHTALMILMGLIYLVIL